MKITLKFNLPATSIKPEDVKQGEAFSATSSTIYMRTNSGYVNLANGYVYGVDSFNNNTYVDRIYENATLVLEPNNEVDHTQSHAYGHCVVGAR